VTKVICKYVLLSVIINEWVCFAIENFSELFGYIATGRVNIRIHRDITGEMWFGVG
jgi:hypothetical protein